VKLLNWGLKEVAYIFAGRFIFGFILSRLILPLATGNASVYVTIADRLLTVFMVYLITHRVSGGGWLSVGLDTERIGRRVAMGLIYGVGLLLILNIGENLVFRFLAVEFQAHPLIGSAREAGTFSRFLIPLLAGGLFTPVAEEMLYRGMLYPAVTRWTGVILGTLVSALIFTIFHFNVFWFAEIFFTGLVLTIIYQKTGSIIPGITAHAAVNSWRLVIAWLG